MLCFGQRYKTNQTVMKARTCLIESKSAWVVLLFCCEAIEKKMKLTIAAPLIDIYSQQDEPLFVPLTSLLVGTFQTSASTCCTLLLMDLQDGKWIKEEKMSKSLRDTSEPGTWCFVLSSF